MHHRPIHIAHYQRLAIRTETHPQVSRKTETFDDRGLLRCDAMLLCWCIPTSRRATVPSTSPDVSTTQHDGTASHCRQREFPSSLCLRQTDTEQYDLPAYRDTQISN